MAVLIRVMTTISVIGRPREPAPAAARPRVGGTALASRRRSIRCFGRTSRRPGRWPPPAGIRQSSRCGGVDAIGDPLDAASMLVTVPSFSGKARPGRTTWAYSSRPTLEALHDHVSRLRSQSSSTSVAPNSWSGGVIDVESPDAGLGPLRARPSGAAVEGRVPRSEVRENSQVLGPRPFGPGPRSAAGRCP